jgi:hypothetical protein
MPRLRSQEMTMRTPVRLLSIGAAALAALVAMPASASAAPSLARPTAFVSAPAAWPAAAIGPLEVSTTIEPNSRLRDTPVTGRVLATTTATDPTSIFCYWHVQPPVTSGGYTTDVWYFLSSVTDPRFRKTNVWSWGGNVNTLGGVDPDPRASVCP